MILPVILAGGYGTRLWPLSRQDHPKQFLSFNDELTLFQQTVIRLNGINCDPPLLICNEEHRFIAAEQMRQLDIEHGGIFLEPAGRNTAPAITLAALHALDIYTKENETNVNIKDDPLLLVLAADHVIENVDAFQLVVKQAAVLAKQGKLVTFGIVATSAETGYGYIKRGKKANVSNEKLYANGEGKEEAFFVECFVEKPDLVKATKYVESGEYYWNSGMFMFKASRYLEILKQFNPDIVMACNKAMQVQNVDMDFVRVDKQAFMDCPSDSIDYAVMEPLTKTTDSEVVVIPLDAGWNDIGSFKALWEMSGQDEHNNAIRGDVKTVDTNNCLIMSDDKLINPIFSLLNDLLIIRFFKHFLVQPFFIK